MGSIGKTSIVFLIIIFVMQACKDKRQDSIQKVLKVPSFQLLKLDSSGILKIDSIPKDRPLIFMYFDPECHLCQEEINNIKSTGPISEDWRIILASRASIEEIVKFSYKNYLFDMPQIIVCKDQNFSFYNVFKMTTIPSTIIYDAKGNLKKMIEGSVTVEEIRNILSDEQAR